MDSLTTLIGKIQAALGDNGSVFSTATCTAAVRAALNDFNAVRPINAGTLIEVVPLQKEYDLSDEFPTGLEVLSLHLAEDDREIPLGFDSYTEDNRLYVHLWSAETSGELLVRCAIPNTIAELDSEVESTLPAAWDQAIVNGGCMYASTIRAASRAEAIVLDKNAVTHYLQLAELYKAAFQKDLARASKQQAPSGDQDTRSWKLDTANRF